ncbi:MAG: hypothetical protein HY226_05635 [Candidatus Vogelbacteria bacterium]|nr:hypothetical protein [Candidatus Vogelbacteria bacterium]
MLEVQKYLLSGKTITDLEKELGIEAVFHPEVPLVILNYSQINSPKTNPIVRECRALVLRSDNFDLVARSFYRFFNWGEGGQVEMDSFNFGKCRGWDKEDGSLINLYYAFGEWRINTRGSFGLGTVGNAGITWRGLFLNTLGLPDTSVFDKVLDRNRSYALELATLSNKVVRMYPEPKAYLLTQFEREKELSPEESDRVAPLIGAHRPSAYDFIGIDQVINFVVERGQTDATYEGVVLFDGIGRSKVKNPRYLSLHKMRGEGQDPFTPKNMLSFILGNEGDELLTYYPEAKQIFEESKRKVDEAFAELAQVWEQHYEIENQKEFALAIIPKTRFSGILFLLRRKGFGQTLNDLQKIWRESGDQILKVLFK